jgi:hypothetical protein
MRLQLCPLCPHRNLQMADKVQRTLAMLTERLDRHRGAGQQSITVKHSSTSPLTVDVRKTSPLHHQLTNSELWYEILRVDRVRDQQFWRFPS